MHRLQWAIWMRGAEAVLLTRHRRQRSGGHLAARCAILSVGSAVALAVVGPGTAGAATAVPVPASPSASTSIESLSPYIPQTSCDPSAKPGAIAFEQLVLRTYPGTGSSGIVM